MEKENMGYVKSKIASRIPLPKEPLPPIPVSLRMKSIGHGTKNIKRCPLKTLNHQAGSSEQNSLRTKKGKPLRIDARRARQDSDKSADVSPSVEHNRVKNIKKKVESPHSKELQGLSPEKAPKPGPPDNCEPKPSRTNPGRLARFMVAISDRIAVWIENAVYRADAIEPSETSYDEHIRLDDEKMFV